MSTQLVVIYRIQQSSYRKRLLVSGKVLICQVGKENTQLRACRIALVRMDEIVQRFLGESASFLSHSISASLKTENDIILSISSYWFGFCENNNWLKVCLLEYEDVCGTMGMLSPRCSVKSSSREHMCSAGLVRYFIFCFPLMEMK